MTPIQQDPARRIRRIQRLLSHSDEVAPRFWSEFPDCVNRKRLNRCDELFVVELHWLCVHSHHQSVTIAEQKARIEELEKQARQLDNIRRVT